MARYIANGQDFRLLKMPLSQYCLPGMDDAVADSVTWDLPFTHKNLGGW